MYSAIFKTLGRIAISAVVLSAATASPQAQTFASARQAPASANQPFSTIDESLIQAANTLLLSPLPIPVSAATKANVEETPSAPNLRIDSRPRPTVDTGQTLASARVDLLRPIIDPILRSRGVPTSMTAVVMVESGGRSTALSPKGARGLWQLMPDTARRYGLRVDQIQDDRIDLFKATDAAAHYLHDLYAQFGDWKLALAAYNTGEANVGAAILRAHTQDFDQLTNLRMLPLETRNYVPRVLTTVQSLGPPSSFVEAHTPAPATTVFAVSTP